MELTELRSRIDAIDRELIGLLERRLDLCAGVAAYKAQNGLPILDPAREREKLAAARDACRPETAPHIAAVLESVMAQSRAWQARVTERDHE